MISSGNTTGLIFGAARRFYSNRTDLLLRRDMSKPLEIPSAKIAVRIRPLAEADIKKVALEVPDRIGILKSAIPTCYLGITDSDEICYMQWLIEASHNHARPQAINLQLAPDQMLLEWAYTFRNFRGLGIMSCAMAQILQQAELRNARWVYTIVERSNVASLKGCRNVGFRPHKLRMEKWRMLYQSQRYEPLSETAGYPFEITNNHKVIEQ
jgi:GNAT superfamily N-acetyltransferase